MTQLYIRPAGWPRDAGTWRDLRAAASPEEALSLSAPVPGFDVDGFARNNFEGLWNRRDHEAMAKFYAEDFTFQGPTDRTFTGLAAYTDFLDSLQSCFPDMELQVDEVYWMGNELDGFLTSERWSATGTHGGDGLYGPATGCEVQVWGITQHKILNGRIVREWMLFNELDLMMQIAAARNQ